MRLSTFLYFFSMAICVFVMATVLIEVFSAVEEILSFRSSLIACSVSAALLVVGAIKEHFEDREAFA